MLLDICPDIYVDSWKEEVIERVDGVKELKDEYCGKVLMEEVKEKKYLGDIISSDGKNELNIKERTNRAIGTVNKIVTSLRERPYGKHEFKAYKIMREGLLIGGMLTNIESWINITKVNIEKLEQPDTSLLKKVLSSEGNPCKSFMMLELGVIPVRYVVMQKRMQFLHYLLQESTESMLRKVFDALKDDSRKGDFVNLSNQDRKELNINYTDIEIENSSKSQWKKIIKSKTQIAALKYLSEENSQREKNKRYFI